MNAVSLDGRFVPLTVTDRVLAEPPAFGVALAHVWPSAHPVDAGGRGGRGGGRRARDRERPELHADPDRRRTAAVRDGGRRAARRRPRRRALPRRRSASTSTTSPSRSRSASRSPRAARSHERCPASAGRASSSSSRPRACCARPRASRRRRRSTGVEWVRTYRQPGWRFGPLLRGADRAGAVLATGADRAEAVSRALAVRRRPYASVSMRTRRSTRLGFQPPAIGEEEIAAVVETLRSGWLTTGPRAALLEERMAAYLEAEHVLAVTSGTAALHLALLALGVGPGDEVITSPITWPATANVIEHCGATPVFCDVRDGDLNIDPALIAALVTERTKAIMPVHFARAAGRPRPDPRARPARSSRTRRTRPRAATAAARSAASPTPPASRSTRPRTSPPARAGSWPRTATTSRRRSATCA